MKYFDSYYLPRTIDEALDLLVRYEGRARVVAGGTDLLLDLSSDYIEGQRPHYAALIDVTRISGANEIRAEGDWVVVGCGVTHTQIVTSSVMRTGATALVEACGLIGGPQVRNVATLVGNIAHALPAADGTIALVALGAEAQIVSSSPRDSRQSEWRPLSALFLGPGKSAVDATREIIAAVRFHPTDAGEASAFARIMRPQGVALPILGMAARVRMRGDVIQAAALSAGPVAPVPFRAVRTEEFLCGKCFSPEMVEAAKQVLSQEVSLRTSPHRATKEYRTELLPGLLEQVLQKAVTRAMN